MDDDLAAIARIRTGAADAFRGLVERHQASVWTFCRNLLRHAADAEDVTQEVFLTAFRRLSSYDAGRSSFGTWLLMLARSRCSDRLQHRSPQSGLDVEPWDHGSSPQHAMTDEEVWTRLDRALDELPLEQRTSFVLAEIQELPHREIAIIEDVEVGTVKSRVSRAKARLRELLRDWNPEIDAEKERTAS